LLLQLGFVYLFNAMSKTGPTWHEGSAVHYVLHQSRIVTAIGAWASHHISFGFLRVLTYVAFVLEWATAVLILVPFGPPYTRRGAIAGMCALHLGFALFLNLALFVPAMLAFSPNLLSPEDWNALETWWAKREHKLPAVDAVKRALERLAPC